MELKAKLCAASEFAVDLEAHSYHSYRGFVCLMQISTRDADYLVDAIELRGSLSILNEAFTNPRITTVRRRRRRPRPRPPADVPPPRARPCRVATLAQVMHGADSDVLGRARPALRRRLLRHRPAARVLHLVVPRPARAVRGRRANKKFALADWRIRPLGDEMIWCAVLPPPRAPRHTRTRDRRENPLLHSCATSDSSWG